MKVLYLYSGRRKDKGKVGVDYPDTKLYGLNHLAKYGIEAEYKQFEDYCPSKFIANLLGFRLRHCLMFFTAKKYDLVFGSSLIYLMPLKIIFRPKAKFVLLNIYLNRLFDANKERFFRFYIIKFLVKRLDGIVCLSTIQKQYLVDNYQFPEEKIFFIPLGIDIDYYRYVSGDIRQRFVLSAGSDDGRDYKAVLDLAKICPDLKFVIVCGFKNLKSIDKSEISDNIKILYYVSSEKLRDIYQKAGFFLIATHPDGYPKGADCSGQTVLLDAMASGIPVIATQRAYLSDYARDGREIIISKSSSPWMLKKKIELLMFNNGLRNKLTKSARERIENNFSSRLMAEKLALCFRKIL